MVAAHGRLARGSRPGEPRQEQLRAAPRARLPGERHAGACAAATASSTTCSTASAARTSSRSTRRGLINISLSTRAPTTTPLFLLKNGFPANFLDPAQIDLPPHPAARGRPGRLRRPRCTSSASARRRCSRGPTSSRSTSSGPRAANLANLINLNQPHRRQRPLPYPDFGLIQWREQNATSSYKGMDLALQRASRSGYGFEPRLHAVRVHRPERRAPLDRRLAEPLAGRARPRRPGKGRAATTRGTASSATSSSSCRSRRTAQRRRRRPCSPTGASPASTPPLRPALHRHPGQQQRRPGAHRAAQPGSAAARGRRRSTSGSSRPTSRRCPRAPSATRERNILRGPDWQSLDLQPAEASSRWAART